MAVITVVDTNNGNSRIGSSISITTLTNVCATGQNIVCDDTGAPGVETDGACIYGNNMENHGARTVLYGSRSKNTGISNSGLGYAVYFDGSPITLSALPITHAVGVGRGVLNPFSNSAVIAGSATEFHFYLAMAWCHRYADPASGLASPNITKYNANPALSNVARVIIHGPNAYDDWGARGNDTIQGNIQGGDLIDMAGLPTGTGEPGKYRVQGGNRVDLGENTNQEAIDYMIIDYSQVAGEMGMQLIDNTGTVRRVKYYDDGSGRNVLYW